MNIKTIIFVLLFFLAILFILFFWQEWNDISIYKKIDSNKFQSFFSILSTIATSVSIFLLYKQNINQIEQIKVANRPNLYPKDQFFNIIKDKFNIVSLEREDLVEDRVIGLFSIHNIGIAAAKDIDIKWHFSKKTFQKYLPEETFKFYKNRSCDSTFLFLKSIEFIEIPLPIMYIQSIISLLHNNSKISSNEWEELYLEINYKDINENMFNSNYFKITTSFNALFLSFKFTKISNQPLFNN